MDQESLTKLKGRAEVTSNKPCGRSLWVCIPSIGETFADVFQSNIFFSSSSLSKTIFLYFYPPKNTPPPFFLLTESPLFGFRNQRPSFLSFSYFFVELGAIDLSRSFKVGGKTCYLL
ncbi:hypothetical protein VP01_2622g1 [Puccinia sorghi]|uniref:Uncharacterized protein n=1 Tax=Puccinia sorghi TaxID=27349 RepID=A0A0L6V4E2_9BASI|nr:hypothetical protein VP01_2622g1 [Puccinia sorghi]